jgi:hypothetical protein
MANSVPEPKPTSSGWWRVIAGIVLVFGVSLGLAFYLPLRQSHDLLTEELASVNAKANKLAEALKETRTALEQESATRQDLDGFKADVQAQRQKYPDLAKRFTDNPDPAIRTALDKKWVQATALADGIGVSWINPTLLNWKRTAPSRTGFRLLCPSLKKAASLGLPQVTVRTYTPSDTAPPDADAAYTKATELAIELAERVVRYCSVSPKTVSVASSPAAEDSPILQFEFHGSAMKEDVGL